MLKITKIELRHLKLPLVRHFETSFGRVHHQDTLIIKISAGKLVGWGECPASAQPHYSAETVVTASYIIKNFLSPLLLGQRLTPETWRTTDFSRIRGHQMAKAGLIMALADLTARQRRIPLAQLYGGTQKHISTGISLGIQDTVGVLLERIAEAQAAGYRRIKVKIKPGWDVKVIAAIRRRFPHLPLSVDANGAYQLADWRLFKALDKYKLVMIEQPLAYDDLVDHSLLQRRIKTTICLDECIKSYHDMEQAIKLGSGWIVNIKQARVGGPGEAIRIHNLCRKHHIPVWCGGLLESGIGRLHNIALASLPGFTMPGDISASARYYEEDVINPPVVLEVGGWLKVPTGIGLGATVLEPRLARYQVSRTVLTQTTEDTENKPQITRMNTD